MSRRDDHFDAMLRELGAAYYQSLHGQRTTGDVARAVESVAAAKDRPSGTEGKAQTTAQPARSGPDTGQAWRPRRRWRVRDVMTTSVAAVDAAASYKDVARLIGERAVNAVPVLAGDRRVLGMVSEANMLRKQERRSRRIGTRLSRRARREKAQAAARTAGELMTTPPITVHPDAPLGSAARLMNGRHIRQLPVVAPSGRLLGIVSRSDLLSVFLRPDEEIARDVRAAIARISLGDPPTVTVRARDGVVELTGSLRQPGPGRNGYADGRRR